jgi:hypothetical protein
MNKWSNCEVADLRGTRVLEYPCHCSEARTEAEPGWRDAGPDRSGTDLSWRRARDRCFAGPERTKIAGSHVRPKGRGTMRDPCRRSMAALGLIRWAPIESHNHLVKYESLIRPTSICSRNRYRHGRLKPRLWICPCRGLWRQRKENSLAAPNGSYWAEKLAAVGCGST